MSSETSKSHINSAKPHKTTKTAKPRKTAKSTTIKGVEVLFIPDDPTPGKWNGKLGTEDCDTDEPNDTENIQGAKTQGEATEATSQPRTEGNETASPETQPANRNAPQTRQTTQETTAGDVPSSAAEAEQLYTTDQPVILVALAREGESRAACWERLRKEARAVGMPRGQGPGTAYAWATSETERLFPPPEPVAVDELPEPEVSPIGDKIQEADEEPGIEAAPPPAADMGVSGLGDLPESWGSLPANASLQVEIAWVSANRLRVRSGSGVDLSRALSPAPSYSALSWLETSILFPSKFADISVKATAQQDDEREGIRREKLAIEEIRGLLAEMLEG